MDADQTTRVSDKPHPIGRNQHLKRVSVLIQSKKYPGQTFVGHALLHEFNPKRLSFFSAQKFPVDDELAIDLDFFGSRAQLKVRMAGIHEQISSGRVMNTIPDEANPFPVRKFYRCYAMIQSLSGRLPGMPASADDGSSGVPAEGATTEVSAAPTAPPSTSAPADTPASAPAAEGEPAVVDAGDSLVALSDKPEDSDEVRAKLAALSAGDSPAAEEKQAA